MPRIFISHSSRDNDAAQTLIRWLKENGFDEVFLDFDRHHGIPPGDDWEKRLYGEIQRASAVTLLLTKNWFESKWCFAEFTQARALGKSVLPIVVTPDGNQFIGDNLQKITLIPDRDEGLSRLLDRLNDIAMEGPAGFRLAKGRAPYPGLLSFDRDDAAVYFGRGPEVRETLEQLERLRRRGGAKILYVHGESGAGKSSLLKAGVLPHLERQANDWIVLPTFRPGSNPLRELQASLRTALPSSGAGLIDALLSTPTPAAAAAVVDALHQAAGEFQSTILLSIDQFEEVFTLATTGEQRQFVLVLTALLDPSLKTLAVATIRTTDLSQVDAEASIASEQRLLGPFPLDRIPEIVRRPAQVVGVEVDDGLVAALTGDAQTSDSLPLVAFLLRRLYDRHADDYKLTRNDYESLGDARAGLRPLETCVRDAAAEAIQKVRPSAEEEASLRETFVPGLVRINDRNQFVRRSLALDDVPPQAQRLVEALVNERLLVRRDGSVEVAHEALFRVWPPLAAWLEEEREFLVGLTRLDAALADWRPTQTAGLNDALLTGVLLSRCEAWLAQFPQRFSGEQRSLIEASTAARVAAAQRKRRQMRIVVASSLAAAALFAILGGVAWQQRTEAQQQTQRAQDQEARATNLAAESEQQRRRAVQGETEAKAATKTAREQAYFAAISLAANRLERGQVSEVRRTLDDAPAEWRNWEWGYLTAQRDMSLASLRGHEDSVTSASFSPDGKRIVTASADKTARVWEAATGRETAVLRGHEDSVHSASFSSDGTRIVTASADKTARVWEVASGRETAVLRGHEDSVSSAAFSPDGARIVTRGVKTARVWDTATGRETAVLRGHEDSIKSASFSHDGTRILTAGDTTARVWDAANGSETAVIRGDGSLVSSASFSPDGTRILTDGFGTAQVWDAATGREIAVLHGDWSLVSLASFSPDGTRVVTASWDNPVRVWDAATGSETAVLRGHEGFVGSAVFSAEAATGRETAVLRGHEDSVSSASFSPDGTRILTASADKTARVWDAASGRETAVLRGHENSVISASFSPDGTRIATASADKTARLWDAATGRKTAVLRAHEYSLDSAVFSADGTRILTAGDDTSRVWDATSGRETAVLRGHEGFVSSASFSPDGTQIVTGSTDKTARLWDAATGRETAVLRGHENYVNAASFSPDGKRIVTGSTDKTSRVWDAATGREMVVLRSHGNTVDSVVFSADGTRVLTAGDSTARVWDSIPVAQRRQAPE